MHQIVLKDPVSVFNPVITYRAGGLDHNPSIWNYAYIPEFGRFYYITDWIADHGQWDAYLQCDVLATWRDNIGGTDLYVLRASAESDGNVVDTLYPTVANPTFSTSEGISPFIHQTNTENISIADGVFVLGITSKYGNYGSVRYCAMNRSNLSALCTALLSDSILTDAGIDTDDASLALQKSLMNPLQYIQSCIWIPIMYESIPGEQSTGLTVWDYTVSNVQYKHMNSNLPYIQNQTYIDLVKHPQAASRGAFLNTAPYTGLWLEFPPFGMIELDTTQFKDSTQIRCFILTDTITGRGILRINNGSVDTNRLEAQIGVQIQLAQVLKDYLGAATSAVNTIGGIASSILSMNPIGAITGAVNGIASGIQAMIPRLSTTGSGGGFSSLRGQPRLYHQFFNLVSEYNAELGRPLCKIRKPSAIPGYIQALGDLVMHAPLPEIDLCQTYIKEGFYYE